MVERFSPVSRAASARLTWPEVARRASRVSVLSTPSCSLSVLRLLPIPSRSATACSRSLTGTGIGSCGSC